VNDDRELAAANRAAWNVAAAKYGPELEARIAARRARRSALFPAERAALALGTGWCDCAVHLQCSFGLDALSLWVEGARRVVGVDISDRMLELARAASDALGAPATWVRADVLETPHALDGTADLVYTGKGALPWVADVGRWAAVVERLLAPNGRLFVYEGHPLDGVWEHEAHAYEPRRDGVGYFDRAARPNVNFPALFIESATPAGREPPRAWERNWTVGDIVTAVAGAGLRVERLTEYPEPFWPVLPNVPDETLRRLPHAFALEARKSAR
jgi:SAM-dependent methyltransferase